MPGAGGPSGTGEGRYPRLSLARNADDADTPFMGGSAADTPATPEQLRASDAERDLAVRGGVDVGGSERRDPGRRFAVEQQHAPCEPIACIELGVVQQPAEDREAVRQMVSIPGAICSGYAESTTRIQLRWPSSGMASDNRDRQVGTAAGTAGAVCAGNEAASRIIIANVLSIGTTPGSRRCCTESGAAAQ